MDAMTTEMERDRMPLDEFDSWRETMYLLSNPANAEHIRQSISELQTGKAKEKVTGLPHKGCRESFSRRS